MAICYVNSGAAGANNGTSKTDAYTTLTAAITGQAAGDTYYVATTHAESTAGAVTLTFKGTLASPDMVLCVDFAGSTPPVAADLSTGASVSTTGANDLAVVATAAAYIEGIAFNAGSAANAANLNVGNTAVSMWFNKCAFKLNNTNAASRLVFGSSGANSNHIVATTAEFGVATQAISINGWLEWVNKPGSAAILGTIPTTLITTINNFFMLSGLDLDALGSGKTIVAYGSGRPDVVGAKIVNCKINGSVTVASAPTSSNRAWVDLLGCNSTTTAERNERYGYQGTLTTEYTIIRTSGATDGTTAYSWKIVPTANNERNFPFETWEGAIWNATTGSSKTLTVEVLTDNVTLTDAEIWLEVEYLGSSATPVTSFVSDGAATVLTTPANQSTSSVTWTTTGIGTPVKQKLECSFTPQMAGPVRWKVKYAKTSTTVYVDPPQALT